MVNTIYLGTKMVRIRYIPGDKNPILRDAVANMEASRSFEQKAKNSTNAHDRAENYEAAAESAHKTALSLHHSGIRDAARRNVVGLYLNAMAGFVETGDFFRANFNLQNAIDVSEKFPTKKARERVKAELEQISIHFDLIRKEEVAPAIDLSSLKHAVRQ